MLVSTLRWLSMVICQAACRCPRVKPGATAAQMSTSSAGRSMMLRAASPIWCSRKRLRQHPASSRRKKPRSTP